MSLFATKSFQFSLGWLGESIGLILIAQMDHRAGPGLAGTWDAWRRGIRAGASPVAIGGRRRSRW